MSLFRKNTRRHTGKLTRCMVCLSIFLLCFPAPVLAADVRVTTNSDDGDGSLRKVIESTADIDEIIFNLVVDNTIKLDSILEITSNALTIDGTNGGAGVILDGNGSCRIFDLKSGVNSITLQNLTLQNGSSSAFGGAIYANSSLALTLGQGVNFGLENDPYSGNSANRGGAIYFANIGSSTLTTTAGHVGFYHNKASDNGGAIYAGNVLTINTGTNGSMTFTGNSATSNGGAIYADSIVLTINTGTSGNVTFTGNSATSNGGAIYANSLLALTLGQGVNFGLENAPDSGNSANRGGAIYFTNIVASTLTATAGHVGFYHNKARDNGGAIYADRMLTINTGTDGSMTFTGNSAISNGGAIYAHSLLIINTGTSGNVTFTGNSAANYGGAIYANGELNVGGNVRFENNSSSYGSGGAIYFASIGYSALTATAGHVGFYHNKASDNGGAIYADSLLTINTGTDGSMTFTGNSAISNGGAIYADSLLTINTDTNGSMTFTGNSAISNGGAIYAGNVLTINTGTNGSMTFTGNSAANYGGAIYASGALTVGGNVRFENNSSGDDSSRSAGGGGGGAIYAAGALTINTGNAGDIHFTGNKAGSVANSISMAGSTTILTGNKAVVFDDPIATSSSNSFTSSAFLAQFAGASTLSTTGSGGAATVTGGEFRVLSGASVATGGTNATGSFTLNNEATLSGAGTVSTQGAMTLSGTIAPTSQRYTPNATDLSLDGTTYGSVIGTLYLSAGSGVTLSGATYALDVASSNTSDKIVVTGSADVAGAKINIASWQNGAYTILTATGGITGSDSMTVTLGGAPLSGRQTADLTGSTSTELVLALSMSALSMTWAGPAGSTWSSGVDTNKVWTNDDDDNTAYFINNDSVTFASTGAGTVNVVTGGVAVASTGEGIPGMKVTAGGYTFIGGKITGDTLALNAFGVTTFKNAIDFSGGITVAAGDTLAFDYTDAATNTNVISGEGGLAKNGNGALTLTGDNTYSGGTNLSAGRINLGHNSALGSGQLSMADGTTLGFSADGLSVGNGIAATGATTLDTGTNNATLSGVISGTGSITKSGDGDLTLSGDSSGYDGTFTQSAGSITLTGAAKLGGRFTQNSGMTLISANGATLDNATFKGTVMPTGTLSVTSASFDGATVNLGTGLGTNKIVVTGDASFTNTEVFFDLSGVSTGSYTLIDYVTVSAESGVRVNAYYADPNRGGYYFDSNDTALKYDFITGSTSLTWAGTSSENAWDNNVSTNTNWSNGNISTWFKNGDDVTFDTGAAHKSVVVNAAGVTVGTMAVNDDYNFSGGKITAGAVTIATGKALGLDISASAPALSAATVDFNTTGKLNITGYTPGTAYPYAPSQQTVITTTNGVSNFNPAVTVLGQASVDFLTASAMLTNANKDVTVETGLTWHSTDPNRKAHGTFTIDGSNEFTLGAVLANNDTSTNLDPSWDGKTLTKAGTGTLTLTGDNTYSGGTNLSAGRINLGHNSALGSGQLSMADGTTLGFSANGLSVGNTIATAGATTLDTGTNNATLSGIISGAGGIAKSGGGVLTLTGNNAYSGGANLNDGRINLGHDSALGSGQLSMADGTTLGFSANGLSVGNTIATAGATTLDTGTNNATLSGVISGTGSITKSGNGALTLSGNSSGYGGTFTQSAGGIALTGTARLGGAFTQNAGTLTSANGAALGSATFKGTVTPTGTLNVTSASFDGATVELGLLADLNTIVASGNASFTGTTVNVDLGGVSVGSYTLIDYGAVSAESGVTVNVFNADANRGGYYFDTPGTALKYDVFTGSTSLTWDGTSTTNAWNNDVSSNTNWLSGNISTWFKNGDDVTFNTGAAYKSIVVDAAGVTVGSMAVNDAYNFSGGKITASGAVTVAAGASLGLNIAAGTPALTAATVNFNNSALNITGYTPGAAYPYAPAQQTVITTTNGVSNFNPAVTVLGQASVDFLTASAMLTNANKDVTVETGLTWHSTDPNRKAHGTFTIDGSNEFTLDANLADNNASTNRDPSWDGTTLTKTGSGALILTGANFYSGGTLLHEGRIVAGNDNALGSGSLTMANGTTLGFAADNLCLGNNITLNDVGIVDSGAYDVELSGIVSGNGGLLKDGVGTLTLSGVNSYTGLTTVRSGTLELGSDLTASSGLTLHSGTTFKRGAVAHNLSGKSLTTWDSAAYDGDLNARGATLNFISSASTVMGSMLGVSGNADITGAFVNLGVAGNANLDMNSTISLLKTTGTLTATGVTQGDGTGAIQAGATVVYDILLTALPDELQATVQSGAATEEAKALSEGFLGGVTLTLQGADLVAGLGLDAAVQAAQNSAGTGPGGYGLGGFATTSGGSVRYNTGSYVDMNSVSVLTGLALGADLTPGRLTVGAFFEYGNGSYDTHNSFSNAASVDGDGSTYYIGGGVLGRMDFKETGPGHVYTEASARMGRLHNDYRSSDLRDSRGRKADYESSSNYYGLHLGTGYVWNITDRASLDLHAKYFWTRQEGDSVSLSTGENVRFKDVDSHRTRLGSRFGFAVNDYITPYVGAAWEYEFDGKARATTNGFGIDAPDLKGSTGIGELGLSAKPSQTLPLIFDLGVQGYTGKREGVTGSLQIKLEF